MVYIKEITLQNFRNYNTLKTQFSPKINIFIGDNAQGKTNLLEAIYFLATGKSHRAFVDKELIRWESSWFFIKGQFQKNERDRSIEIYYDGSRKQIKVNKRKIKIGELVGQINVVMFSPEDLQLVKGSPGGRRRFIDLEISQIDGQYYYSLLQYQKILQQRNNLLKEIAFDKSKVSLLPIWNMQLVETGTKIIEKRLEALRKLNILASLMERKITSGIENLNLTYMHSLTPLNNDLNMNIKEVFEMELKKKEKEEIQRKLTLCGPHRDDFLFSVNGIDLRKYGSQGQQRTAILALKLAELEYMKSETGEYPLLLLDDVMSELDSSRQQHLVETIKHRVQTFITATDKEEFRKQKFGEVTLFEVESGNIMG